MLFRIGFQLHFTLWLHWHHLQTSSTQPDLFPNHSLDVSHCERRTQVQVVPNGGCTLPRQHAFQNETVRLSCGGYRGAGWLHGVKLPGNDVRINHSRKRIEKRYEFLEHLARIANADCKVGWL